ncbi:MAG: alpha-L-fucosidase [Thermogutta sp.]|nr:alpha-L-fucosidase [Thermogutta sp.]HOP76886.1 alpha-L-fucosidase [Thermogutta sp.]HPU05194.1 alpha-L-fucosidase [Thermogutta sp.]HQF13386.1 alpha-L-fucosidase [Thermogutta sp.]
MTTVRCIIRALWVTSCLAWLVLCQGAVKGEESTSIWSAPPESLAKWQAMRFGLFIHWGPVSLKGTEIGWSRGAQVPIEEYDNLYKQFNPTKFNADEWVSIAKEAGMKYLVITSKHHDGFCIWDSEYTDYDIMSTPFKRDILKELSEACRRQGIVFCAYHSICDWYHPDYPLGSPGGRTKKPNPNMERYVQYLHNQIAEIIRKYGPLGVIWFDGDWEEPWTHEHGLALYKYIRTLQPDILINNRIDKGRRGMKGDTAGPQFVGDFDTPEQRVGAFNRERPWETCMTICRQWAWKPNDELKTLSQCLEILLRTVGGDGNLLLNVGPMPDGQIEPRQVERLKEIGAWLKKYGDGVYGTRGGPFKPGPWGASTCKENKIYVFIFNWPKEGPLVLPAINQKIVSAVARTGGDVKVEQSNTQITVSLSPEQRDPLVTVLELTVSGTAFDIPPVAVPALSGALSVNRPTKASNVFQKQVARFGPQMAVDDDSETRWATDAGTHSAWLEVDLERPCVVDRAVIEEAFAPRVQEFQIECAQGDEWVPCFKGTTIGERGEFRFRAVTGQRFRLNILKATEGPTIWEFQLFGSEKKE